LGNNNGQVYRGVRSAKPAPELPQLKPGEYRCECGAAVKLISTGLLRNHRTLLHNVPCIHSHTEPKEEPCPDIATR
jgi:hypothetical protein